MTIQEDEPQQGDLFVHHSIRIANEGRTAAKNCNVLLTIEGIVETDIVYDASRRVYLDVNTYRPVKDESLCWSFQTPDSTGKAVNPAFLPISPRSTRLIELCRVHRGKPWDIEIPSEMGWEIRRVILRGEKEYEFELKIIAENVQYDPKKHSKRFKLIPDSAKRDVTVKPLDS